MVMQSLAWAQGTTGGGGSGGGMGSLVSLVPFVLIFVIFYFLLILPQQKQQKKLLEALKKGDKIITASGIWGTIANLGKDTVTLQIADNTKIKIQREQIARLRGEEEE